MKKILSFFLVLCLVFSLSACNNNPVETTPTEDENVFYKNEYIALNDYRDVVFDFYQFEVSDKDLELYINYHLLLPNAVYTEVKEGPVNAEDYVHVFVTTKDEDGNIIEKYTTGEDGYFLYVGLNDFMAGLDDVVVDMNVGETKQYETVIKEEATTVPVTVEVTVDYIRLSEFPEATDEIAIKEGYDSLEEFKNQYRAELESAYAEEAYGVFLDAVKRVAIKEIYEYPQDMLDSYIKKYKESLAFYARHYKMTEAQYLEYFSRLTYDEWLKQAEEQAKDDVEQELLLNAILEAYGLSLDEKTYKHYLDTMAEQAGYESGKALEQSMEKQGVLGDLKRELTMNYGYDILLLTAKMRLVNWTTGEVIVDYVEETTPQN